MNDRDEPFVPEKAILRGAGVDYWSRRKDKNDASKTDVDLWRSRQQLSQAMEEAARRMDGETEN